MIAVNEIIGKFTLKLRHLLSLIAPFALLLTASPSFAEEDGRLGSESESRITISLSILPTIQVEAVSDVHLDIQDRDVDASYEEAFCVTGNSTKYSVIAYGSSDGNRNFSLSNIDGEILVYSVAYRGDLKRDEFDILTPGKPSPVYDSQALDTSCAETPNFRINFRSEDLKSVRSGLYNGALTLMVSPV